METWCYKQRDKGPRRECRADRERQRKKVLETKSPVGSTLPTCSSCAHEERLPSGNAPSPSLHILTCSCFPFRRRSWAGRHIACGFSLWDAPACRGRLLRALSCTMSLAGPNAYSCSSAWWVNSIWDSEPGGSLLLHVISKHLSHVFQPNF